MYNWKNKTAIYIGRFQPFHEGHKRLFLRALKKNKQVAILVMDSQGVGIKNPFSFKQVKKKIIQNLKEHKKQFIIIKIPVVSELIYGRKVGYKIRKIKLEKKIENISATKIRKKILNEKFKKN
jgi:cytidyltransferase-like protein